MKVKLSKGGGEKRSVACELDGMWILSLRCSRERREDVPAISWTIAQCSRRLGRQSPVERRSKVWR